MFKKKCFICRQKDEKRNLNVRYVGGYDYYTNYYYHTECLEYASCNAKHFNDSVLNMVISIIDMIKKKNANRAKLLLKCNKICKEMTATEAPTGNPHQTM